MFQRLIILFAATFFLAACETASQTAGDSSGDSTSSSTTASSSASTSGTGSASSSGSAASSSSSSSSAASDDVDSKLAAVGNTVYFAFDSAALTSEAQGTLTRQAALLKMNPATTVTIEGHCDERGTREYNLALGERRASASRDFLLAQGIDAARVRIISYGKERPAVQGSNEEAWAKNRRAATIIN
jgi:peptidoglycan-associated lipoprotein